MKARLVVLFKNGGFAATPPLAESTLNEFTEVLNGSMVGITRCGNHVPPGSFTFCDIKDDEGRIIMRFKSDEVIGYYLTDAVSTSEKAVKLLEDINKDVNKGDEWKDE